MRFLIILMLTMSFGLVGCASKDKKEDKKAEDKKAEVAKKPQKAKMVVPEGQLPDHDFEIYQPYASEIMVIIDARGKAKRIPNEWDVDTSGHMAYSLSKPIVVKKAKRSTASVKKKSKNKKKKRKYKKRRKKKAQ